ncbi:MAG: hypothetical protein JWQ62_3091, partial [Lacunisphaera sp.]|nr:hypothetical protein [Lacunisphaera sp.]
VHEMNLNTEDTEFTERLTAQSQVWD